jgi:uncharacterized protein YhaN
MKILELQCLAFGPFTDLCLDLSAGDHGLHVLFGPNEAGKSSALRALRALLYGIPNQTPDNFLHENPRLRLGGCLRHSDGTELRLIRRKGLKNTLLDLDGRPLPEAVLGKFLAGVGQELFSTMFGLDHPALRRGGEEILQGGGEVGHSLFSAALGGVSVRHIQQSLENEARQLFLPRGDNPRLNKALSAYKAVKRTMEEHSLAGGKWAEHTQLYEETLAARQAVVAELTRLAQEQHRLERLQAALPKIARRQELLRLGQQYRDVIPLPPEFAEQRREAVQQIEQARQAEHDARLTLQRLSAERQRLVVPEGLLTQAEAITLLQQRLGSHRHAAQERSKLLGQRRQLEADVRSLLAKLPPHLTLERLRERRLQAAQRARVQELARQYQARLEGVERATREVQKYAEHVAKATQALHALAASRDPSALRRAIVQARQQGDLEEAGAQVRLALQAESEQATLEIGRLGCWSGTLEELERLSIPSRETVEQFETTCAQLDADLRHLHGEMRQVQAELADCDRLLAELRLAGAVPSEEELTRVRQDRDELWRRVRRAWLAGETEGSDDGQSGEPSDLAQAYADSVTRADEVADRLRREAERVARQAALVAQRGQSAQTLVRLAAEREKLEAEQRQQQRRWHELWQAAGIVPLSPREMRAWMERYAKLVERAARVRESRHQLQRLHERLQESTTAMRQALERLGEPRGAPSETFRALLAGGEAVIEAIEEAARRRRELETQLAAVEQELENARGDQRQAAVLLTRWRADWTAAVTRLGLESTALPAEASAVLEVLHELSMKQDEVDKTAQRIEAIERDAQSFAQEVAHLAAQVAPDLLEVPAEQAAVQLQTRLGCAQTDSARSAELDKQIVAHEASLQRAQSTIARMTERLQHLCRQAGCADFDALPVAEARSTARQQWQHDLAAVEAQLLEQSAGATLEELIQEAEELEVDLLPERLHELTRQRQALEERRSDLEQALGREREILSQMDGSGRAAEAAEQAQALLAELRQGVERYVRLRLASVLLRREVERYRANSQGPLLDRASGLFSQLTLGAFARLETEYNDKDQPVLVGVRADGRQVGAEGMSDGTRDQLYLSLRLASLERYLDGYEPMPFIVDDILIQFDDQRAKAALMVLAELSRQTQVIFFTHHWRLAELARELGDRSVVQVQSLRA